MKNSVASRIAISATGVWLDAPDDDALALLCEPPVLVAGRVGVGLGVVTGAGAPRSGDVATFRRSELSCVALEVFGGTVPPSPCVPLGDEPPAVGSTSTYWATAELSGEGRGFPASATGVEHQATLSAATASGSCARMVGKHFTVGHRVAGSPRCGCACSRLLYSVVMRPALILAASAVTALVVLFTVQSSLRPATPKIAGYGSISAFSPIPFVAFSDLIVGWGPWPSARAARVLPSVPTHVKGSGAVRVVARRGRPFGVYSAIRVKEPKGTTLSLEIWVRGGASSESAIVAVREEGGARRPLDSARRRVVLTPAWRRIRFHGTVRVHDRTSFRIVVLRVGHILRGDEFSVEGAVLATL